MRHIDERLQRQIQQRIASVLRDAVMNSPLDEIVFKSKLGPMQLKCLRGAKLYVDSPLAS